MFETLTSTVKFVTVLGVFITEHGFWFLVSIAIVAFLAYKWWSEQTRQWLIAFLISLVFSIIMNLLLWKDAVEILNPPVLRSSGQLMQ